MNDDLPIFVASPIEIYHGEKAQEMLTQTNDNRFHTDADGIIKVDLQRWEQAQSYERKTWMEYNLEATEDRNTAHAQLFDHYAALPENLGDVLEIGCGPFTNIYKILQNGHEANSITLVDPLLNQYQAHPNKNYNRFTVPKTLISSAFEDTDVSNGQYDTVIIINVLPHCRDAKLVLDKAQTALRPGGYLVFAEFPASAKPTELYDVGHPIAPTAAYLADFLQGFEEVYRHGWYFIGRKANETLYNDLKQQAQTIGLKPVPEEYVVEWIGDPPLHTEEIAPGVEVTHVEKEPPPAEKPASYEGSPAETFDNAIADMFYVKEQKDKPTERRVSKPTAKRTKKAK